jgi:hypothetical protein
LFVPGQVVLFSVVLGGGAMGVSGELVKLSRLLVIFVV